MVKNDPKVIAGLLRALASGTDYKASMHDVIFNAAADLLDPSTGSEFGPCPLCGTPQHLYKHYGN